MEQPGDFGAAGDGVISVKIREQPEVINHSGPAVLLQANIERLDAELTVEEAPADDPCGGGDGGDGDADVATLLVPTDSGLGEEPASIVQPIFLHQCGQCETLPSFWPDCLKISTWLRAAKVDFKVFNHKLALDDRFPTVEIGDGEITNSGHILEQLAKRLDRDLDENLSSEQKTLVYSLGKMVDLTLGNVHRDWCRSNRGDLLKAYNLDLKKMWKTWLPRSISEFWFKRTSTSSSKRSVGHRPQDQDETTRVLRMLADLMGEKRFLLGEDISTLDVEVFSVIAPILGISEKVGFQLKDYIKQNFPNLVLLVDRIKESLYPDWEKLCGVEKEVPKQEGKSTANNEELEEWSDSNNIRSMVTEIF